jgi:heparan sulfate 2-O-sulfotransferase HS2ST1
MYKILLRVLLQELPRPGDFDDTVIIYNRVPKTGSTSFAGVAYDLCNHNKFHVLHLNVSRNNHVLGLSDQV